MEGEFGAHSLEFYIPATLRLRRGFLAEIKNSHSWTPNSLFFKEKKATHTGSIHTDCINRYDVTHTHLSFF